MAAKIQIFVYNPLKGNEPRHIRVLQLEKTDAEVDCWRVLQGKVKVVSVNQCTFDALSYDWIGPKCRIRLSIIGLI
jgi:hypothetical protein